MNTLKKWMITLTIGSSFIVLAHSVLDNAKFYELDFADSNDEVVFESNISTQRFVASTEEKLSPSKIKIPLSQVENIEKNKWEIIRISNTNGKVAYDKNLESDQNAKIIVNLKTVNLHKIRLNDNKSLEYSISLYKKTTMLLFHKVNNTIEILGLRKIKSNTIASAPVVNYNKKVKKVIKAKGMQYNNEEELIAFSAVDPSRNRRALLSNQISGSIEVVDGELNVSNLVLHKGTNLETEALSFSTRILDGGVVRFTDEKTGSIASAILMNNGQSGYTLRFTSGGPIGGSLVNFFTPEEVDKKQRVAELESERNQENQIENTNQVNDQRRIVASKSGNNDDNYDDNLNKDENSDEEYEQNANLDQQESEENTKGYEF